MNAHYPSHVAVCMDGNRRWSKARMLPVITGHKAGMSSLKQIIAYCSDAPIGTLSVFAFSQDNWKREDAETNNLMRLFLSGLQREISHLHKLNVKLVFIGERSTLNQNLQDQMDYAENLTSKNSSLTLIVAVNYTGHWDITQALARLKDSNITVSPESIEANLQTASIPNPDLLIRTSGEMRISNFFLWQLAYTELYFSDVLWPDFDVSAFQKAIEWFQKRNRRFGSN